MDEMSFVLTGTPIPADIAAIQYQTAFDTAIFFGVLMLIVGLAAGIMAGYGLHKIISRGGLWRDLEQSGD